MPPAEPDLSNFFVELKKLEQNGQYEKASKVASKVLGIAPNHEKAIQCKIVSLIQLNQFEEALDFIEKQSDTIKSNLHFEKAYSEYRLNKVDEAFKSLKLADSDDFGVQELNTQALYRIENFEDCYSGYVDLVKNSSDDYEDERYVNMAAAIAGLKFEKEDFKFDTSNLAENTYEVIYNKACILIADGQYEAAIKKLNEAEVSCRKFLEDDGATEEEIDAELCIIKGQIAFCFQKLNKTDVALKTYNQIFRQKLSDAALISVVSNNIVSIHKDQNLFDSKKKIKLALSEAAESKLSSNQKRNIFFNYCLFLSNTNQYDTCRSQLQTFRAKFASHTTDAVLIESYLHIKEKKMNEAIKTLKSYVGKLKSLDSNELGIVLLLAQLLLKQGDLAGATNTLESFDDLKYQLAIISLLVMLYEKSKNTGAIEKLFTEAVKWHQAAKSPVSTLSKLYNEAAKFYLNQNKPQVSVKYLEKIIQIKGKNPKILSMLINAYSQFDAAKAQSFQKELPSIEDILNSVDIEHLENKNWSLGVKYVKKSKDTPKEATEKKKKKKRKKILPKNFNPNEKPDPERWLPRYERSNYRKKKDKKGVGKGTQGAVGDAPEIKPSPKPVASPPGPRQQRPTAAQKKKKKGGRK